MSFHTRLTLQASRYAPPDTEVSGLQLVAVERLLSIEGTAEILMDVTFLRGPCRSASQRLPFQWPIPPIRGKCPEGTKGVGMLSEKQTERLLQI